MNIDNFMLDLEYQQLTQQINEVTACMNALAESPFVAKDTLQLLGACYIQHKALSEQRRTLGNTLMDLEFGV